MWRISVCTTTCTRWSAVIRWYCNLPQCSSVCVLWFFSFWKGIRGLGRPCRSKTNPLPQAGKPETSLSIWGRGAGAPSFFQVLLFTVVILPRRDCDFYRKSLQTGLRWWEVEEHTYAENTFIHTHTCAHKVQSFHTQTEGENWLVAPGWSLGKDKARRE